jgi:hypothetical protein
MFRRAAERYTDDSLRQANAARRKAIPHIVLGLATLVFAYITHPGSGKWFADIGTAVLFLSGLFFLIRYEIANYRALRGLRRR